MKRMLRRSILIYLFGAVLFFNLALTGVFLWMFFSGMLEVRAKKIVVLDSNKIERIHLDPESSDVRILGKVFKRRSPSSGIILFNTKGDETGGFASLEDGTVSLTIDSYEGKKVSERVSIFHLNSGESGFLIKDIENNTRLKVQLNSDNKIDLKVFDKTEKELKSFTFE